MDTKRKKEIMQEYKNRKPTMGIISFCCLKTNDTFIMGAKDTKACINSNTFQLNAGNNSNKDLQKQWNEFGKDCFKIEVREVLPYSSDESITDYSKDLELLCSLILENDIKTKLLNKMIIR